MSAAATPLARPPLRVALRVADARRGAALKRSLAEMGHVAVTDTDVADVVLAAAGEEVDVGLPTIALGPAGDNVAGVLPPDATPAQIDAALHAVTAGLIVRSPGVARGFQPMPDEPQAALTPRELEVLSAIAEGLTNKAIARRLGISLHTVKFHVESIFRKLGTRTRTEAVARARREAVSL